MKQPAKTLFNRLYFPGMISIVCLPLLCIGYFAYRTGFKQLAMLDVVWSTDASIKSWNDHFATKININDFKDYPQYIINEDAFNNQKVLSKVKALCREVIRKKEYGKGVTVNFADESEYRDLINVIDAGYNLKEITYILYNNSIIFTLTKPYKVKNVPNLGNDMVFMCDAGDFHSFTSDFLLPITNKITQYSKEFWPSIIAFLMMMFFSIKRRKFITI